ncbi:MAG: DUF1801 domain-containing protein [Myxococcota bacterium]
MNDDVRRAFQDCPPSVRRDLLRMRSLIFQAAAHESIPDLVESLKWGQPAYRPLHGGTTVRLGRLKEQPDRAALFVTCSTSLVDMFRLEFEDAFDFVGKRALLPKPGVPLPEEAIRTCVQSAFTYHRFRPPNRVRRNRD